MVRVFWRKWRVFSACLLTVHLLTVNLVRTNTPGGNSRKLRLAVCITGQLSRLEIRSKVLGVFEPAERAGVFTRAFVVVQDNREPIYTSDITYALKHTSHKSRIEVQQDYRARLAPWLAKFDVREQNFDAIPAVNLSVLPFYRSEKDTARRKFLLKAHISQFSMVRNCAQLIVAYEQVHSIQFDTILKLRDNTVVLKPYVVPSPVKRLKAAVFIKDCGGWGGYNDKTAIIPREYMEIVLRGWVETLLLDYSKEIHGRSKNSETFLKHLLVLNKIPVHLVSADEMPFVDARLYMGSEPCLVSHEKDCHPAPPWEFYVEQCRKASVSRVY